MELFVHFLILCRWCGSVKVTAARFHFSIDFLILQKAIYTFNFDNYEPKILFEEFISFWFIFLLLDEKQKPFNFRITIGLTWSFSKNNIYTWKLRESLIMTHFMFTLAYVPIYSSIIDLLLLLLNGGRGVYSAHFVCFILLFWVICCEPLLLSSRGFKCAHLRSGFNAVKCPLKRADCLNDAWHYWLAEKNKWDVFYTFKCSKMMKLDVVF